MILNDIITKIFDIIFPKNISFAKFLDSYLINQPSNILDIACEAGDFKLKNAQKTHKIYLLQNNTHLVEQAITRALFASIIVTFDIFDLMQIDYYNIQIFDFIFCIGNAAAHIKSIEELNNFVSNIYKYLCSTVLFITQAASFNHQNIINKNLSIITNYLFQYNIGLLTTVKQYTLIFLKYVCNNPPHIILNNLFRRTFNIFIDFVEPIYYKLNTLPAFHTA